MLSRTGSCRTILTVAMTIGIVVPLMAQQSENINIANGLVARIRTPGPYANLKERAAAIDKAIAEVISTQDTQNPQVSLKEVDGRWHIFVGPVKVIGIYPAEAEANAIDARELAAIWAYNIKQRLPLTTPVSKMPAGATLPQVSTTVSPPPPPKPAGTALAETEEEPPRAPTAEEEATMEPAVPRSAPLLLIVDAFNVVRNLPEEDYLLKREEVAVNLMKNLRPFMALPAPVEVPAPAAVEAPAPITGRATVGPPAVVPAPPEAPTEAPAVVEGPVALATEFIPVPGISATEGIPEGHEDDPAYVRVPQKHRIRAKFKFAGEPYQQLLAEDAESAQAIGELLKVARTAFAAGNFDDSERYLDHALRLLGAVPLPE